MPVTTLDPRTALLVVDLQEGITSRPTVHDTDQVTAEASRLAAAFRARELPVVLITVDGLAPGRTDQQPEGAPTLPPGGLGALRPELAAAAGDLYVVKQRWGAFSGTELDARLRERDVTQVVLVGVATSAGVESTARGAYERGYHVTVALDAITDTDPELHRGSAERVFPRIAETGSTTEILALLD